MRDLVLRNPKEYGIYIERSLNLRLRQSTQGRTPHSPSWKGRDLDLSGKSTYKVHWMADNL